MLHLNFLSCFNGIVSYVFTVCLVFGVVVSIQAAVDHVSLLRIVKWSEVLLLQLVISTHLLIFFFGDEIHNDYI